ncbi:MAG: hypothetical protein Q8L46_01695 [candidate division WWE3 bacterium]|nr:hypothetical protein [candidate division WWE3 bacterium]
MTTLKTSEPKLLIDERGKPTHLVIPIKIAGDFLDARELTKLVKASKKADFLPWEKVKAKYLL